MATTETQREQREWWYVNVDSDEPVSRVRGYSCGPENPDYWWCPSVGVSAGVGHHLFESELAAREQARKELTARIRRDTARLQHLGCAACAPQE